MMRSDPGSGAVDTSEGERDGSKPALAFGPIPSRRLGRSLGINNIPPKICSYSCVYCQVGVTASPGSRPRSIYPPERVSREVAALVERVLARGEPIDYLTFAPDGEPTLDANLLREIELLRPLGIPIAIISNGSLAWRPEVRDALNAADWVSVKVDAVEEEVLRRIDRPHPSLELPTILEGIRELAVEFPGVLVSETMLVAGLNDDASSVAEVGAFLGEVGISTAYLSIPTRPPAVPEVRGPDEAVVTRAFHALATRIPRVELLVGYEGDAFAASGDASADLLAITAVHPLRDSAVRGLLVRSDSGWEVVERLVAEGLIRTVEHEGLRFYVRTFVRPEPVRGCDPAT